MTTKEEKSIHEVRDLLSQIRDSNKTFREDVMIMVGDLVCKVEQKQMPFSLENEIVKAVQTSLDEAIKNALTGYNSPLEKYAINVVSRYQNSIEEIFNKVVEEGIASDEFKLRVREVLLHKIAKTVTSGIDGSIDNTVNLMKQNPIFRSRLTLAVNGLVEEFLKQPA